MTHLLQRLPYTLILTFALLLPLITFEAQAQITISVDDIDPWYGRILHVIDSSVDEPDDDAAVLSILEATGEDATYDFRGLAFTETFSGTLRYLRMSPGGPGGDVDYLSPSTMVMEMTTEMVEDIMEMTVWGFSEVRDDSVFQRGGILYYNLLVELEDYESTADTMLFEPPTFSNPVSYTYGDSWTVPPVVPGLLQDTEVEVTGYGTLITPTGQERQALRIERTTGSFGFEMKTIEFVTGADDGVPGISGSIDLTMIGDEVVIGSVSFVETTGEAGTSVAEAGAVPQALRISTNYPNPFSSNTTIPFELAESGAVDLRVYDMLGREVAVVVDAVLPAGRHEVNFDATELPSGTYLYRIEAAGTTRSSVMTVAR